VDIHSPGGHKPKQQFGADLLRLPSLRKMNAPIASIGGAGTFDGIFVTGLVAVLLS
jgi:uncharacterized membrane protein